jgi:hypothetical protein
METQLDPRGLHRAGGLGQGRRPKIMERRPDPPQTSFDIDEEKLRRALPAPVSSTAEDLKWSGAFIGIIVGFIAFVLFGVYLLLRVFV